MLRIEARQLFSSNGLIDDLIVVGLPQDYVKFSEVVNVALSSEKFERIKVKDSFIIEVEVNQVHESEIFTSLQNETNEYYSLKDWENRRILRVKGGREALIELSEFLVDLSQKGTGYSYISEYSTEYGYSIYSPEWRLMVEST